MKSRKDPKKPAQRPQRLIPPPRDPIDWKEAARLYLEENLSYAEIARRMGRHPQGIRQALLRHGIPGRKRRALVSAPHGERLRGLWKRLRTDCCNPHSPSYKHYGARGLRLCKEWEKFAAFYDWAIASGYQPGQSLVLAGRAKIYSPRNCRWISRAEMDKRRARLHPRPPHRLVTAFGETKGAAAWARDRRCKVTLDSLCLRLKKGWLPEDAIALPARATPSAPPRPGRRRQKGKRRRRRPEELAKYWQRVIHLHVEKGLNCTEIARIVGRTSGAILVGLKRRGMYRPRRHKLSDLKYGRTLRYAWNRIQGACRNSNHAAFKYYGAKGVRVAAAWRTFEAFHAWALESGYRPGLCLTRVDRRRGYSPSNCTWVSRVDATKHADHPPPARKPRWKVEAFGETKGLSGWSVDPRCAVSRTALSLRLRSGMPAEAAITLPPQRPGKPPLLLIAAFGEEKTAFEWSRDRRCRVRDRALKRRLSIGIPPELAITTAPYKLHDDKRLKEDTRGKPRKPVSRRPARTAARSR